MTGETEPAGAHGDKGDTGAQGPRGRPGLRGRRGSRGAWSSGSSRLREYALLFTYIILVGSIWWDIHISNGNADRIVSQAQFAALQRAVLVHNEGIIIHNQQIICRNQVLTPVPLGRSCRGIQLDFEP